MGLCYYVSKTNQSMSERISIVKEFIQNIIPFNNRKDMPVWQFAVKKFLAFWLCYIVGIFAAEGFAILLHFVCGKNPLAGEMFDMQTMTLIKYYGYIIVIGVALLYWKLIEKKPFVDMGITGKVHDYFIGVVLSIALLAMSVGMILLTGAFEYHGIFDDIHFRMILLLIGGFVVQGAMEELLCRGIVFHALMEKTHISVAIGVSTLVFILPHWPSLFAGELIYGVIGLVNLMLISVIFCLLTLRFQNIWAACGLHSFWNIILYAVLGLNLSGNEEAVTAVFQIQSAGENILNGGIYGIEASILTAGILLATVVLLEIRMKKAGGTA